jgi:hypothetical protein
VVKASVAHVHHCCKIVQSWLAIVYDALFF